MHLTALLIVSAFVLIAWDASRRDRKPLTAILGLAMLGLAFFFHLFSGERLIDIAITASAEVGTGLILAATLSALRHASARPFFALGVLTLLVSGTLYGGSRLLGVSAHPGSLLVELGPDDRIEELQPILHHFDARAEKAFPQMSSAMDEDLAQVYLIYAPVDRFPALSAALAEDVENVDYVEDNVTIQLHPPDQSSYEGETPESVLENDPMAGQQWALDAIHGHAAHAFLRDQEPVKKALVAIVDTGVDAGHEDMDAVFHDSPARQDGNGHGSHCAGIAGAATNNNRGIASLNWDGRFLEIAGYQALTAGGSGTVEMIAQAVIDATRDGADVISMSLGYRTTTAPRVLTNAIDFALKKGVVVVVSAGNDNEDARRHFPSNVEGVITVAAVDEHLNKARFSNTNMRLSRPIAAPGVNILSLRPGDGYVRLSGTSMSTPMVAGLIGIMRSFRPNLTADEAFDILNSTGTKVNDSDRIGRVINAAGALRALVQGV